MFTIRKGIIKSFDSGSFTAGVQIIGSPSVWLENVTISRALWNTTITPGLYCAVLSFDAANPSDCVVTDTWT